MTELEHYKALLDWLGEKGKVNEQDLADFDRELARKQEAKTFIDDNFNGMF